VEKELENWMKQLHDHYANWAYPLPDKTQWRHYRYVDWQGNFHKIKDQIRNPKDLAKHFQKTIPRSVYATTGLFLDPAEVGSRTNTYPIFLSSTLVFDIDSKNLTTGKEQVTKLIAYMEQAWNLTDPHIVASGQIGHFHIYYPSWKLDDEEENPVKRETNYLKEKKKIADDVANKGIEIDKNTTWDTRRLLRLPYSINPITGYMVTPILDIETFSYSNIPKLIMPHQKIFRQKKNLITPQHKPSLEYAITNRILGKHAYILIQQYLNEASANINGIRLAEKGVQTHMFQINNHYYLISFETMNRESVEKHLKDNTNLFTFQKYGCNQLPILIHEGKQMHQLKWLRTFHVNPQKLKGKHWSQPHVQYLLPNYNITGITTKGDLEIIAQYRSS
jgi:hypothetical protein